jgi:hypothetical protein
MNKPLIDRMAEALTALLSEADEFASLMPKCEEGSPSGEAERVLAEYRNRPPEISQETARELLEAAGHYSVCDFPDAIDFRCEGCNQARAAIARAEAELKGR